MKKTCYLFGSKSLLIQCFNFINEQGYVVKAVVSDDAAITSWAKSQDIQVFAIADQEKVLSMGAVDYIFSITHLKIIPASILKLAENMAINFHDGLLPGYAGLNVTSWAIYNRETTHGITWHEMTDSVDEGSILKQIKFDIDEKETAFTLNAKCYEAALSSFADLLSDISADKLKRVAQGAGESAFYKRCQRVKGMAILDWQHDAEHIDATIRALHFGPYSNPLSLPKILLKNKILFIHQAEIVDRPVGLPGEVMAVDPVLEVSANNAVLSFTSIIDDQGQLQDLNKLLSEGFINVGDILPAVDETMVVELTSRDENFCKQEDVWLNRFQELEQLVPLAATDNKSNSTNKLQVTSSQQLSQLAGLSVETIQSYLTLFFSRHSCQSEFSIFFYHNEKNVINRLLIEKCLPIAFDIDFNKSVSELIQSGEDKIKESVGSGGYCKDLLCRHPELNLQPITKTLVISELDSNEKLDLCDEIDLLLAVNKQTSDIVWQYNEGRYSGEKITRLQSLFEVFVTNALNNTQASLAETTLLSRSDYDRLINSWNETESDYDKSFCVHQLFENQVETSASAVALSFSGKTLSYADLNKSANRVAHYLVSRNIQPDQLVGVLLDRSIEMVVTMMGILKAGAAYLPLDPAYPKDRIEYMIDDAQVASVITQNAYVAYVDELPINVLCLDDEKNELADFLDTNPNTKVTADNLVYTIYTSGSTGKPKGVMVEHKNVVSFFHGMDQVITDAKGVWLAVTSISFDISVLEIFWTLANGYEVALFADEQRKSAKKIRTAYPQQDMEFSLFYWNVADDESEYDDDVYRLLMESAKYGDKNNFKALWTPERHFHSFGGLYPNPSVTSAALAAITEKIHIRAGSCVIPLHHPVRVAEDWSMIDNISKGRVGIAIAAGWQANDFVIMPDNFADAKSIMFESLETVRKLWRGDTVEFPGHDGKKVPVRTLPRPIQKELPVWVTTAGNPDTFRQAGEVGGNILTHLLGQTVDNVAVNIDIYREAYKKAGHEGDGHVTVLLHTLVGENDEKVKELARAPMKKYLKSAMFLVKAAAWNFPTFQEVSEKTGQTLDEFFEKITDEDLDAILEFAFLRYYETSGLFGTPERCLAMVDRLKEIGVNEIGCLIDYGLDTDNVLNHLPHLNDLRKLGIKQVDSVDYDDDLSIPDIIHSRQVTHLQCTPSMASLLVADSATSEELKTIRHMMVGGEALPINLAKELAARVQGKVTNMYGPTETTIWSTTQTIGSQDEKIHIGKPIANTQVYVLDKFRMPVPVNTPGELYISGAGVVRGYHKREDLSAEKFVRNPFVNDTGSLMYGTGDLVQYDESGALECLGRIDHQIKIRGYRIELGEIEALLLNDSTVADAIVILREDVANDKRLVAYVTAASGKAVDQAQLKNRLSAALPEFMVPGIFVVIERLPLTPNGKVDRNALPAPGQKKQSHSRASFVKPENELQQTIVSIWQGVLKLDKIGLDDNFFDIGGHSLLVVEVLSKLRKKIDKPVKMIDMFRFPTIRQFSQSLTGEKEDNKKLLESEDRAKARKDARKNTINRRRARQK